MSWRLAYTRHARNDARKLSASGLKPETEPLLELLADDPWQTPPPFEKLIGDLSGAYSRRSNIQHRLIYQVLDDIQTVKVLRLWSHYE